MPISRIALVPVILTLLCFRSGNAVPPAPASAPLAIRIPAWLEHEPAGAVATSDFHVTIDGSEAPVLAIERPSDELRRRSLRFQGCVSCVKS